MKVEEIKGVEEALRDAVKKVIEIREEIKALLKEIGELNCKVSILEEEERKEKEGILENLEGLDYSKVPEEEEEEEEISAILSRLKGEEKI